MCVFSKVRKSDFTLLSLDRPMSCPAQRTAGGLRHAHTPTHTHSHLRAPITCISAVPALTTASNNLRQPPYFITPSFYRRNKSAPCIQLQEHGMNSRVSSAVFFENNSSHDGAIACSIFRNYLYFSYIYTLCSLCAARTYCSHLCLSIRRHYETFM